MNLSYLDIIINQLKTNCAVFNGNVAGGGDYATDFQKAQTVNLPVPAAYVIPVEMDFDENQAGTGTWKIATDRYACVVLLNNPDRRGQKPITDILQIKWFLLKALQKFVVDPERCSPQGINITGGQIIGLDAARMWFQFDFEFEYSIGDEDAWQPTGTPLTSINVTMPLAQDVGDIIQLPTTTNYVHFADAHDATYFATTDLDTSALSGVDFSVFADDIDNGDFSTITTTLASIPSTFKLLIGMPPYNTSLSTTKTYPFQTVTINDNGTNLIIPVISDPNYFPWMLEKWLAIYDYLQTQNAASRLVVLNFVPCGQGGQFNIQSSSANTPAQNIAFWENYGITSATVPTLLVSWLQLLMAQPQFAALQYEMAVFHPYDDAVSGAGDGGASYLAIQAALQAAAPSNYVLIDQTFEYPAERVVVRQAANGHPFACQLNESQTDAMAIASYKLALTYNPLWVEWQTQYVPTLTNWLKGYQTSNDAGDSYQFTVNLPQ